MPTITVKLNAKRAVRLSQWAERRNLPKSEIIRGLIDRAGPIETGEDLAVAQTLRTEARDLSGLGRRGVGGRGR